ncbi:hypothetical protein LJB86_05630 [Deltaproteobacteria bacterium OttesenSCG-928-M10]|nr:hypothetical protein [Deltaproteobacteria bacterium OttesenSCG-928-M10]
MGQSTHEVGITMDLIFNELSLYKIISEHDAKRLMTELIGTLKTVQEPRKKRKIGIRFNDYIDAVKFYDLHVNGNTYTLEDWRKKSNIEFQFLISIARTPCIPNASNLNEEKFIENSYSYNSMQFPNAKCHGLTVALCWDLPAISLASQDEWKNNSVPINVTSINPPNTSRQETICNIFSRNCYNVPSVRDKIERCFPIIPDETDIPWRQKSIKLRDDHRKDYLLEYSQKIVKSKYVLEVINSLSFAPAERQFISDISEDGVIKIRLHWTDRGLGIAIKTTGKTRLETEYIAKKLRYEYENKG